MPAPIYPPICPVHHSAVTSHTGNSSKCHESQEDFRQGFAFFALPGRPRGKPFEQFEDPSIEYNVCGMAILYRDQEMDRYWDRAEFMIETMVKDDILKMESRKSLALILDEIKENGGLGFDGSPQYTPYPDLYPDVIVLDKPGNEIFKSGYRQIVSGVELVQTHRYSFDESELVIFIPQRGSAWVVPVTRTPVTVRVWRYYRDQQLSRGIRYDIDGHPFGEEPRAYVRAVRSIGSKFWWVVPQNMPAGIGVYFRKPEDVVRDVYRRDAHRFIEKLCRCTR